MQIEFEVRGSRGDTYNVVATKIPGDLKITCNCQAGQFGQYCKHRFALMNGDITNLESENVNDIEILREFVRGSDIEKYLKLIDEIETQKALVNKKLKAAKSALARSMNSIK